MRLNAGEGTHALFNAFYDVKIGSLFFAPEVFVLTANSTEPAYGLNIKIRKELTLDPVELIADAGGQFGVWDDINAPGGPPKRAHVGLPIDLSAEIPISGPIELELTANYTPMWFLGADVYQRNLFGVISGIRIVVS